MQNYMGSLKHIASHQDKSVFEWFLSENKMLLILEKCARWKRCIITDTSFPESLNTGPHCMWPIGCDKAARESKVTFLKHKFSVPTALIRLGQTGNLNISLHPTPVVQWRKGVVIRACCLLPQGEQIGSKTLIDIIFKRPFYVQEVEGYGTEHGTSDVQVSHIHYIY